MKPEHYRDVLRAVVKAVYSSDDASAAGRLSKAIIRGSDYIYAQNRRTSEIQDLETSVGFISVALQKQGHNIEGVSLVKK